MSLCPITIKSYVRECPAAVKTNTQEVDPTWCFGDRPCYELNPLDVTINQCSEIKLCNEQFNVIEILPDGLIGEAVITIENQLCDEWHIFSDCSAIVIREKTQIKLGEIHAKAIRVCIHTESPCHTATSGTLNINLFKK